MTLLAFVIFLFMLVTAGVFLVGTGLYMADTICKAYCHEPKQIRRS